MASYPTAVKTFTSKSTADVVQAAHINDLQDEVNAIEAGLLNGTAPLNSSNSTVANLSVTGGSTLGTLNSSKSTLANLSVTGGSTFAGNIGCTGVLGSSGARIRELWVGQLDASSGIIVSSGSPLQSSNSTLAALSVSGGSTLNTLQADISTLARLTISSAASTSPLTYTLYRNNVIAAWGVEIGGNLTASFNIATVRESGGTYGFKFGTALASSGYCAVPSSGNVTARAASSVTITTSTGTIHIIVVGP